jgi:ribosome recycling factor
VSVKEVLDHAEETMHKTVENTRKDLASVRSGHASPGLVDHVKVEYHGTPMTVNQVATVNAPEARLLTIQPWDRSMLNTIEKALLKSDLGITPSNDGTMIRLSLPPLSEQRRKELVKLIQKRIEEGRVAIRNIRRDAADSVKKLDRNREISEDEARRAQEQLQKLTDAQIAVVEKLGHEKEQELLEV